jgi:hypothetical protein
MSTTAISLPRLARRNPLAMIGVVLVITFVASAIFAPGSRPTTQRISIAQPTALADIVTLVRH